MFSHIKKQIYEVMDISNHHFKYLTILHVNYNSIKLKLKKNTAVGFENEGDTGEIAVD